MQQEQQTALHIAARLGAVDCMLLLLENGANPDAATIEQYTALHIAAKEGHEDVVQLLLDRGADSGLVTSVSIYVNLIFTTLFSYHYHVITVAQRGWAGCCFWLQHCVCLFVCYNCRFGSRLSSATVVSTEPFLHRTGTL